MNVDFFFDPICPFCWMTSKWLRLVSPHRGLQVDWRFISLRMINDGTYEGREQYIPRHEKGLELLRVAAAVREVHGADATGRLYEAFGNGIWESDRLAYPDNVVQFGDSREIERALAVAGLPEQLAGARSNTSFDDAISADGRTAFDRTGEGVGTPIITYNAPEGPSLFGPVISTLPSVDRSLAMWDALVTLSAHPDFAEVKRSRRGALDLPVYR
jgi:hypothetical protein